jgi:hypothetical protein
MNTRGEKSLAIRAKQQIGICCETLCERAPVEQYIKELEEKIALYEIMYNIKKVNTNNEK